MKKSDQELVKFIRQICAREFDLPENHQFFKFEQDPNETNDEFLLRRFKEERQFHDSGEETVLVLCHG